MFVLEKHGALTLMSQPSSTMVNMQVYVTPPLHSLFGMKVRCSSTSYSQLFSDSCFFKRKPLQSGFKCIMPSKSCSSFIIRSSGMEAGSDEVEVCVNLVSSNMLDDLQAVVGAVCGEGTDVIEMFVERVEE